MPRAVPAVLSIAGSDSGGGAGIQADLKAFARCGVHGMTAITAMTAQNTVGVTAVHAVPPEFIVEQVRAGGDDIGVDAVKIGMLGTAETVAGRRHARSTCWTRRTPVVIDPVMVAESGAVLLDDDARAALSDLLAAARDRGHAEPPGGARARRRPRARTPRTSPARSTRSAPHAVVVTGGHRDEATDVFFDGVTLETDPGRAPSRRRGARLRAARTPRRSPPTSRSATTRSSRRAVAREVASRGGPQRPARSSAPAPARWTCST